jgi:hypothetical protein
MGDEPPRAPGRNDQGMNERLDVPGHDEPEALAPGLLDRLGAGLQALAGIIVAALFVRSRPTCRGPKVPIRSTLMRGIPMTDASSSTASSQQQRLPRFADSAPFGVRELAPAFDSDESGVKPPHALGAGLTTPTKSTNGHMPANGLRGKPRSRFEAPGRRMIGTAGRSCSTSSDTPDAGMTAGAGRSQARPTAFRPS